MIFDTHMHCDYSCDSHMKIAEAVAAAKQQNIGIVITVSTGTMITRRIRVHLCLM